MTVVTRSSEAPAPPSILAVNGNPEICEGFTQLLTPKGYEVKSVSDGGACLESMQQRAFSAVILHDRLPDQDGLVLLTTIRTIQPRLPVIVTTTRDSSPEALQQGAFAVLVIPYRRDELHDTLHRAIFPMTGSDPNERATKSKAMKVSYDEDRVLTDYVWQHYRHLFTKFERKVSDSIIIEMKTKHSTPEVLAERLARLWGPPDDAVTTALEGGHWAFLDRVRARILAEAADQVVINRCPLCRRIVRTPKARMCLWCHHDWHTATAR